MSCLKFSLLSVALSAVIFLQSCDNPKVDQKTIFSIDRPIGSEIDVFWNLVENGYKGKSSYLSEFMITNNSLKTLDSTGWSIYFHQPRRVIMESTSKNISITHVNGDYFRLEPTASFPSSTIGCKIISRSSMLRPARYCLLLSSFPVKFGSSLVFSNFLSKSIICSLNFL